MSDVDGDAKPLRRTPKKELRKAAKSIHQFLLEAGCIGYVKTIYIGYEIDGDMVAALYPHVESLELALAIPEN